MILSGIPQAVVASRAGKICDFPGNKGCQLQPDFDFSQIIVCKYSCFSVSNALWRSLWRKNVWCKNQIWECKSVGITMGHEDFGGTQLNSVLNFPS